MDSGQSMLSIDFWDTLVVAEVGGKTRRRIRNEALCEVSFSYVENLPNREIEEATRLASEHFNRIWFNQQRTSGTEELLNYILNHLGIPATEDELRFLCKKFEESLLEGPPELADGVQETLSALSKRYSLALISDTMFSPGKVIRAFLEERELLSHFDGFVFSDEVGYSKPNPKAFHRMLEETRSDPERSWHVGDLVKTDIKGAKDAGMGAILFTGISGTKHSDDAGVEPDHICTSWDEVGDLLLG